MDIAIDRQRQGLPGGAVRILSREVGFGPSLSSHGPHWKNLHLCRWEGAAQDVHYASFDEVILVLQNAPGRWRARHDGRWLEQESVPGRLTVVPAGTPLDWSVAGRVDAWTLHLPSGSFEGLCGDVPGGRLARQVAFEFGSDDPFLKATTAALAQELQQPCGDGALYVSTLADGIRLHLLRRARAGIPEPAQGLPRAALGRVLERIEARVADGITLDELASLAGCGRSHFTAAFRASMQRSPLQYLRERRIERAKERLARGGESLAEIALSLGYADQAHFSTAFRIAVGVSPLRYRRSAS